MEREDFVRSHWDYLKMLSGIYSFKFFVEWDDLFQEGALAVVEVFDAYSKKLNESDLKKIAKKVANRKMYAYVKRELKVRRFFA